MASIEGAAMWIAFAALGQTRRRGHLHHDAMDPTDSDWAGFVWYQLAPELIPAGYYRCRRECVRH